MPTRFTIGPPKSVIMASAKTAESALHTPTVMATATQQALAVPKGSMLFNTALLQKQPAPELKIMAGPAGSTSSASSPSNSVPLFHLPLPQQPLPQQPTQLLTTPSATVANTSSATPGSTTVVRGGSGSSTPMDTSGDTDSSASAGSSTSSPAAVSPVATATTAAATPATKPAVNWKLLGIIGAAGFAWFKLRGK